MMLLIMIMISAVVASFFVARWLWRMNPKDSGALIGGSFVVIVLVVAIAKPLAVVGAIVASIYFIIKNAG